MSERPVPPPTDPARRPALVARLAAFLRLERPGDRMLLALGFIILTLISPDISLPGSLPAIRLEQILLLLILPLLAAFHGRHPEARHVGLVDVAFLGLGIATTMTIVLAPIIVAGVTRSYRDLFEIGRVAEYWVLYRIGTTLVPPERPTSFLTRGLALAALPLSLFAVLQFIGPPGFNDLVTAFWTQAHNLAGVTSEGRAVGTAGNANQFGILAVLFLSVGLGALSSSLGHSRKLFRVSISAAVVALLLTQSRGALLAAGIAMLVGLVLLLLQRRARGGFLRALPPLLVGVGLTLVVVVSAPSGGAAVLSRFDLLSIARDPSLIIRLGRVQSLFAGPAQLPAAGGSDPAACVGSLFDTTSDDGHAPGAMPPYTAPSAVTLDVQAVARAVSGYYCDRGKWPDAIGTDLVPTYLPALPVNPATGQNYGLYTSPRGYLVGSPVAPADGTEAAGFGSLPNLLVNPSFEMGNDAPAQWLASPGADLVRDPTGAAFGTWAGMASLPPGGAVYQFIVADLPMSTPYSASIWVRATGTDSARIQLYVVAITAGGQRLDPIAQTTLTVPGDHRWHQLATSLETPNQHLTSLQFLVRAPGPAAHFDLDGAALAEGPYPRAFEGLHDVPPSQQAGFGPSFLDSPILGVGPQKEEQVSTFDNEYADFLQHYGVVGLLAYGFLMVAAFWTACRRAFERSTWLGAIGLGIAPFVAALGAFAITAGAYRQLQVMVIFWILVGLLAATHGRVDGDADGSLAATHPLGAP